MRYAIPESDDSAFGTAAVLIKTTHEFDHPADALWDVLNADDAWNWLPFTGVEYLSAERAVGMVRDMGLVKRPFRWVWLQRERFFRFEPGSRLTYSAINGSWPLLEAWVEDYRVEPTATGSRLTWTVALTPRFIGWLPLHWTEPFWRALFTIGIRPGLRHKLKVRARSLAVLSAN